MKNQWPISRRGTLKGLGATAALTAISACGSRTRTQKHEAVVIGAGISGLYAATLLQDMGVEATVLEASDRVGGRMKTLDHLAGSPEAGGQTIGPMYARVLSLVERFNLQKFNRVKAVEGKTYFLNGNLSRAGASFPTGDAKMTERERTLPPEKLYSYYLDKINPLEGLYDWRSEKYWPFDGLSVQTAMQNAGASNEALRLMERWFDGGGLDNMSALFACRKSEAAKLETSSFRIKGGSSRLPEAMAQGLKKYPRLSSPVSAIEDLGRLVRVTCEDGHKIEAEHVFVSVPFSVLKDISISPAPHTRLPKAIQSLPYNHITQVKIGFTERFWEQDGFSPNMYCDSFVERVTAVNGQDGSLHYLNIWIKGLQAAELDKLPASEIGQAVLKEFERIRPASQGKISVADVTSWGRNPYSKGAYHFFGVGGTQSYGNDLIKPVGRIHWIGEHAAEFQQGMEGACESAEREVFAMVEQG